LAGKGKDPGGNSNFPAGPTAAGYNERGSGAG